jgi:hypothetical protein
MKNSLRYLAPLLGLTAIAPLRAAEEAKESAPAEHREMRVIVGPGGDEQNVRRDRHRVMVHGGKAEMESVAFLGVETSPVGPTLAAQLNLPRGAGLVVGNVVPDSPAAAVLKQHDILVKLDDQLLIEPRQFSVLVRNHKEGDEVTLTLVRGGKETTAKVKLGKREMPKFSWTEGGQPFSGQAFAWQDGGLAPAVGRVDMDRMLSLMDGGAVPGLRRLHVSRGEDRPGPGDRTISVTVNTGDSNMVFSDEKGSLELKIDDGKKDLVAKNAKGDVVFSGPVNTPEERKAMPADVRARLEKIESMHDFSFKTDEDFKPGQVKVVRPPGTKIRLPLRMVPVREPSPVF